MKKNIRLGLIAFVVGLTAVFSSCFLFDYIEPVAPGEGPTTTTTAPLFTGPNYIQNSTFSTEFSGTLPSDRADPNAFNSWPPAWDVTMPTPAADGVTSTIFKPSADGSGRSDLGFADNNCIITYTGVGNMVVRIKQTGISIPVTGTYLLQLRAVGGSGVFTIKTTLTGDAVLDGETDGKRIINHPSLSATTVGATGWDRANWKHYIFPIEVTSTGTADLTIEIVYGASGLGKNMFLRIDDVTLNSGYVVTTPPASIFFLPN